MRDRYILPLVKKESIAEGTNAYWFDIENSGFAFKAGQAADFTLLNPRERDDQGSTRTFSLSSSPKDEGSVMITTRNGPSAFKRSLDAMPIEGKIQVSEPTGTFVLHRDAQKPAIFIAGGMGITPFRSIVRSAIAESLPHTMYLFYSNPQKGSMAFYGELAGYAKQYPNFRFIPTLTQEQSASWPHELGRIDAAMLMKHVQEDDRRNAFYYIASGPAFVTAMLPFIERVGGNPDLIKTEEFPGY